MASILNLDALRSTNVTRDPYPFILASDFLQKEKVPDLKGAFPPIDKPGYLTVDEVNLKGSFKQLIDELEGPALTDVLSERFGMDLRPYPRLTTIMKRSQSKYGAIHTDGPSKVMTLLVYMNDDWSPEGPGRLRVLYDEKKFEPYAAEVPPTMGTVFAFLRSDHSWHGHQPFVGERKVVQVAWIKDAAELERKKRRNSFAQKLKAIIGR
jgi:SM-20-related protein